MNDDDIRDAVAHFILDSATDPDCLYEPVMDAYIDSLPDGLNDVNYSEDEDRRLTDLAYAMHGRAKVSVVIDEVEYNGH